RVVEKRRIRFGSCVGWRIVAPEQEIVCARCSSGFTQSTRPGELGNRTHRRGDYGKPEFRPFSRMAAKCGWQASRLDVRGQRRRGSREPFAFALLSRLSQT